MAGNLVSLERVHKAYGVRPLLADVSLGIGEGDKVGVVGRNGDGKTTLLRVLAGLEPADDGRVTRNRGLRLGYLTQGDDLDPAATVREAQRDLKQLEMDINNDRQKNGLERVVLDVTGEVSEPVD